MAAIPMQIGSRVHTYIHDAVGRSHETAPASSLLAADGPQIQSDQTNIFIARFWHEKDLNDERHQSQLAGG